MLAVAIHFSYICLKIDRSLTNTVSLIIAFVFAFSYCRATNFFPSVNDWIVLMSTGSVVVSIGKNSEIDNTTRKIKNIIPKEIVDHEAALNIKRLQIISPKMDR